MEIVPPSPVPVKPTKGGGETAAAKIPLVAVSKELAIVIDSEASSIIFPPLPVKKVALVMLPP